MAKRPKKQEGKDLTDAEIVSAINEKISKEFSKNSPVKKEFDPQQIPMVVEYLLMDVESLEAEKRYLESLLEKRGY